MSLTHLILGLLRDAPATGYDLNKRIEATIAHFWQTDHTQIYRALHTLEQQGWVTVEAVIQQDAPNKKIYAMTPSGLGELQRWMATPQPEKVHEAWVGKIFFGDVLTTAEMTALIEQRISQVEMALNILKALETYWQAQFSSVRITRQLAFRRMSRLYGTHMLSAEVAWLRQTLADIQLFDDKFATDEGDAT